ncbi:nucleobase-ascorbate transporter 12 [Tanacetum coccineum]
MLERGTTENVQCYNCSEKGHYGHNCPKPKVLDSKYFMEQILLAKQDEAGVILTDKHNDFLFADASRMEEIEELNQPIRHIHQLDTTYQPFYSDNTRSFTKELITPFENPKRVFCSKRKLFETPGLVESSSPELDLFSDIKEHSEEETIEIMTETMEQYMSKTRGNYGSGLVRPKINDKTHFELKGQYLKDLRENTFSGSEHEDANKHIGKVLEIVDLFHIPKVTQDQVML